MNVAGGSEVTLAKMLESLEVLVDEVTAVELDVVGAVLVEALRSLEMLDIEVVSVVVDLDEVVDTNELDDEELMAVSLKYHLRCDGAIHREVVASSVDAGGAGSK